MDEKNNQPVEVPLSHNAGGVLALPGMDIPAKRGRGRPAGTVKKLPPLGAPAVGAAQPGTDLRPAGNIPPALWTAENSKPFGQLVFMVPAIATGWDGWALEEKESRMISEPLAQVLNILVPVGSQYAAFAALATTVFVVGGMKYKGFREYLKANPDKYPPKEAKK